LTGIKKGAILRTRHGVEERRAKCQTEEFYMCGDPVRGERLFKKNPTAKRDRSRKIKTYYEKTGTKINALDG